MLPWSKLGRTIESATRKALYDFSLLEGVEHLAVALSGGKDSLTLLYMLKAISGRGFPPFSLHAIHITGAFSCGAGVEIPYLRSVCQEIDVPLIIEKTDQKQETLECYSCSRKRRSLLFHAAKRIGATTIAFGHHKDDNVQTLLMNLLHKGEFAGNLPKIPMHDYGITIIRPLIYVAEEQIRSFAHNQGFARILCRCPVGQHSMRRQVRDVVKELEELFPHARDNLSLACHLYGTKKAAQPKT